MAEGKKGGVVCEEVAEFEKRCLSIWPSLSLLRLANVARARNRQRWPWRGQRRSCNSAAYGSVFCRHTEPFEGPNLALSSAYLSGLWWGCSMLLTTLR